MWAIRVRCAHEGTVAHVEVLAAMEQEVQAGRAYALALVSLIASAAAALLRWWPAAAPLFVLGLVAYSAWLRVQMRRR
jgi:CHASE2 domain-containing sensor protein